MTTDPDRNPEFLNARVTWHPRGGSPVTVQSDYLNAWGVPVLNCGMGEILRDLGIILPTDTHVRITLEVNRQLAQHDWAVIKCPHGIARLEVLR
ncbi:hypothetical protein KIH27_16120 [Mycobacterium sp. M1]|uniref:Uncharacterized protein n=1 Tax=Mycolicibacter acidiphilus TaxID=2835306 RepID=A0ABS5RLF1_9MYCO|nr:hypothetical protein [Mycolicibacter acidiphilus]MBS9535115.1 hypothetical protein [Mycolicibacter acidiphilus]